MKSMKRTTITMMALLALALPVRADVFSDLASYKYGDETKAAEKLAELVKETAPDKYGPIEAKLIAILESKTATQDGKAFACRNLQQIATEKAIPALASLLGDKVLSHYARLALERMKCAGSLAALRDALPGAPDCVKPGLMGSLAMRKDAESVETIAKLLGSSDKAVVKGALDSLSKIATPAALTALARATVTDDLKPKHVESVILCAATLGDKDALHKVFADCPCDVQKSAALVALVRLDDAKAPGLVVQAVNAKPSRLREGAMQILVSVPSDSLTKTVLAGLPGMTPATRAHVIELLGKRGDKTALPVLVKTCTTDKNDAVRVAAGKALAELGGPEHVKMLLGLPAGPDIVMPMPAGGVDEALIALLGDKDVNASAIQALGKRGAHKATAKIIALTGDSREDVRNAAWTALAGLAVEADLPKLTDLLVKMPAGTERDRAGSAVRTLASGASNESKDKAFQTLAANYEKSDTKMRQFILEIGPAFATSQALAIETTALESGSEAARDKALRSLAAWPNPEPCPALLKLAETGKTDTQKILALRAYLDLASKSGSNEQKLARSKKALPLIRRAEEKRLLVSKLRNIHHADSLKLAETFFDDSAVAKEAMNAALDIVRRWRRGKDTNAVIATLKRIVESDKDKDLVQRAEKALKDLTPRK